MLNIQNIFDQSNKRNYICIKLKTQNDINMRRIITMICLIVAGYTQVSAQQLYKKVYDNAIAVVNNAKSTDEQIQVNQFKVTAMNYMTSQIKKSGKEQDSYFYDSQAVNMASFITDFETNVMKARAMSTAKRLQVIEIYRDASLKNPLFNDPDKETAYCYVNDKATFTPFSLDTNWEKAYEIATQKIKELFK
mgnify:FL=1